MFKAGGEAWQMCKKPGLANGSATDELEVRWMLNLKWRAFPYPGCVSSRVCECESAQAGSQNNQNSHQFMTKTQVIN